MKRWLVAASVLLCGCAPYRDFTLPVLNAKPGTLSWSLDVRPSPVLPLETGASDVLNPSVIVLDSTFYNFYSLFDGKSWHTALATSADAVTWSVRGKVLSPQPNTWEGDYIAANGSTLRSANEFLYWYQGGREPRIGLARSTDGLHWTRNAEPVLDHGPRGSWDERGVADPYVVHFGQHLYMFFLGQDRAQRQRLGVARSQDGVRWEKLTSNPILELGSAGAFDEVGLGEPAVFAYEGSYWMLYTGRDRGENRAIGMARSQDGIHWTRVARDPILRGDQPWDTKVVCDPTVIVSPSGIRVWFGGGDRPEPAENLHGQIGYALLRLKIS